MESFFERVKGFWPAGRQDLHWHLLPDRELARTALVEPYRQLTHRDGLAPIPAEWIHVTVLHGAPVEQVSTTELDKLTAGMRERCAQLAPVTITLHPPMVGSVALECAGRPGAPARAVWQAAIDTNIEVLGDRMIGPRANYEPHAALAYCDVPQVNGAPLKAWLSDNAADPVTFTASQVTLVAQHHDGHHIIWEHLLDVPLAG